MHETIMAQPTRPLLIMFSGLPGTGKSTLGYALAERNHWVLLAKDAIDRGLEQSDITDGRPGYDVLLGLAALNLQRGNSVVLDAVFGLEGLRQQAAVVAEASGARLRPVYCYNSQTEQWRQRITQRPAVVAGWTPADWSEVERVQRYFEPLADDFLALDSSQPLDLVLQQLLAFIALV